jgi:hypothetical protein
VRRIYQTAQATNRAQPQPSSPYNQAYGNPTISPFALQPFQYGGSDTPLPAPSSPPAYNYPREPGGASAGLSPTPRVPGVPGVTPGPWASGYVAPSVQYGAPTAAVNAPGASGGTGAGPDWLTSTGIWRDFQAGPVQQSRAAGLDDVTGFSRWYFNEYLPAQERGYAPLRARIQRAGVRRNESGGGGTEAQPLEVQSLRYNPPPTSWRIGG